MNLLDAVNLILRKIGEIPVTSVDEQYPTLPLALAALDESRKAVLSEGYWFNTFYEAVLQPNTDGEVRTPPETIKFFPADPAYVYAGAFIRRPDGSRDLGVPVKGRLVVDMPFEDLPETVRNVVAYSAAYNTYLADIGPDSTLAELAAQRDGYLRQLNGDHTTSRKHNSRQRKQVLRYYQSLRT